MDSNLIMWRLNEILKRPEEIQSQLLADLVQQQEVEDQKSHDQKARRMCSVAIENGVAFVYMPDGTKIPKQLDFTFEQPFDHAFGSDKVPFFKVGITLFATMGDTAPFVHPEPTSVVFEPAESLETNG